MDSMMNDSASTVRRVQRITAGGLEFGIFRDEIHSSADWRMPTPLPRAPATVLGVVCIRGRMITVLDISALAGGEASPAAKIVALNGDEQIGLAVNQVSDEIDVNENDLVKEPQNPLLVGSAALNGESLRILNTKKLFGVVMRGRERRKRQF
jgi:chemotaxis signal transduction protein